MGYLIFLKLKKITKKVENLKNILLKVLSKTIKWLIIIFKSLNKATPASGVQIKYILLDSYLKSFNNKYYKELNDK